MGIFRIKQLEKGIGNILVFPKFDLQIQCGEAIAIQCNKEVGTQLIHMILGLTPILNGEIPLEDEPISPSYPLFTLILLHFFASSCACDCRFFRAKEKGKNTLRGLMLSPASILEILLGKSALTAITTTLVIIGSIF